MDLLDRLRTFILSTIGDEVLWAIVLFKLYLYLVTYYIFSAQIMRTHLTQLKAH